MRSIHTIPRSLSMRRVAGTVLLLSGVMSIAFSSLTAPAGAAQRQRPSLSHFSYQNTAAGSLRQKQFVSKLKKLSALSPRNEKNLRSHGAASPSTVQPQSTRVLTTIYVTTTHDVDGSTFDTCTTTGKLACSLRAALAKVLLIETTSDPTNLPVVVTVPAGTYHLTDVYGTYFSALQARAYYGVIIKGAGETATKIFAKGTATNPDRVFDIGNYFDPTPATISTLTVSGGSAPYRHALTVTSTNCIKKTFGAYSGGDISDCNTHSVTVLNNVRVTEGTADVGGGIYAEGSMWVINSLMTTNLASNTYTSSLPTTFSADGGALFSAGNVKVVNSTIDNNVAISHNNFYSLGGAIAMLHTTLLTLTGGTISTNVSSNTTPTGTEAYAYGGALGVRGIASIHGTSFNNNEATSSSTTGGGLGGAIWVTGFLRTVSTASFNSNIAHGARAAGGAFFWFFELPPTGPTVFLNVEFLTNAATAMGKGAGGGAISSLESLTYDGITLTHVTMQRNAIETLGTTLSSGGALSVFQTGTTPPSEAHNSIIINNSTVSTNSAFGSGMEVLGGGIYVSSYLPVGLTVIDSTIANNLATAETLDTLALGGGIFFGTESNSHFEYDTVTGNVAMSPGKSQGGGIVDAGCDCVATFSHLTLTDNEAVTNAAGIAGGTFAFHFTSSTIADNVLTGETVLPGLSETGDSAGAGMTMDMEYLTMSNTTIATNTANYTGSGFSNGGGANFSVSHVANLSSVTVVGNRAGIASGIFIDGITGGSMAGTVISGNVSLAETTTGKYFTTPTNCEFSTLLTNGGGNYLGENAQNTTMQKCVSSTGTTGTTPMLAPLANNGGGVLTRVPELGSPLLNNGGYACLGVDEIGQPRPAKDCTSGAFEESVGTGYTAVASDGGVFAFPSPLFHGSTGALTLNKPVVAMATTPAGLGYWLAASDGGIFAFGNASFLGSLPQLHVGVSDIVGIASTPDGLGYWMVGADGAVYAFGDAVFKGSLPGTGVTTTNIVGVAPHGSDGYWLVGSNGAVYAFGSANYRGGANTLVLNKEIVGIAADPTGEGYWLVGSDGGVFGYGSASGRYFGSMGGQHLNKPIVGIASTGDGEGYWLVASDGGVFNYGDATFQGSTGSLVLNKPVVGIS